MSQADSPLTPDEVRALLRECVTVVKPGETLAVLLGPDVPAQRWSELQRMANEMHRDGWPQVWFLPGEEFGVIEGPIQPEPVDEAVLAQMPRPRRWDYPLGWGDDGDA